MEYFVSMYSENICQLLSICVTLLRQIAIIAADHFEFEYLYDVDKIVIAYLEY